uniref:WD_REPEATS_REGION domain-containing protein n=1 Tax=Rhabditophanes sp. KR3021 TaxID=114890 RepID=A0AC35TZ70_9BILA
MCIGVWEQKDRQVIFIRTAMGGVYIAIGQNQSQTLRLKFQVRKVAYIKSTDVIVISALSAVYYFTTKQTLKSNQVLEMSSTEEGIGMEPFNIFNSHAPIQDIWLANKGLDNDIVIILTFHYVIVLLDAGKKPFHIKLDMPPIPLCLSYIAKPTGGRFSLIVGNENGYLVFWDKTLIAKQPSDFCPQIIEFSGNGVSSETKMTTASDDGYVVQLQFGDLKVFIDSLYEKYLKNNRKIVHPNENESDESTDFAILEENETYSRRLARASHIENYQIIYDINHMESINLHGCTAPLKMEVSTVHKCKDRRLLIKSRHCTYMMSDDYSYTTQEVAKQKGNKNKQLYLSEGGKLTRLLGPDDFIEVSIIAPSLEVFPNSFSVTKDDICKMQPILVLSEANLIQKSELQVKAKYRDGRQFNTTIKIPFDLLYRVNVEDKFYGCDEFENALVFKGKQPHLHDVFPEFKEIKGKKMLTFVYHNDGYINGNLHNSRDQYNNQHHVCFQSTKNYRRLYIRGKQFHNHMCLCLQEYLDRIKTLDRKYEFHAEIDIKYFLDQINKFDLLAFDVFAQRFISNQFKKQEIVCVGLLNHLALLLTINGGPSNVFDGTFVEKADKKDILRKLLITAMHRYLGEALPTHFSDCHFLTAYYKVFPNEELIPKNRYPKNDERY